MIPLAAAVSVLLTPMAPGAPADQPADLQRIAASLNVDRVAITEVGVVEQSETHTVAEAVIEGEAVRFFLMPHSVRAEDFKLLVVGPDGIPEEIEPQPSATIRGTVLDWPGSSVTGSLRNGRLTAHVHGGDGAQWLIQPLATVMPGDTTTRHAVYRVEDLLPADGHCGVTHTAREGPAAVAPGDVPPPMPASGGTVLTDVSFESDFEFYDDNNRSVTETADDIETVMLIIDDIYRRDVRIAYVINHIIVWTTENDPYTHTDPADLLDQFRDYWRDRRPHLQRDVAHLMTGRDLDGNVIGFAKIGQVCNPHAGYGISQSSWSTNMVRRAALTAHELGHNWDAEHCDGDNDCAIMCSSIGGCTGTMDRFGAEAEDSIMDHRNSRGCLAETRSVTYLDAGYDGLEEGTESRPYDTFREGIWATDAGGSMILRGGVYDAERSAQIVNRAVTVTAQSGTGAVRIGQ